MITAVAVRLENEALTTLLKFKKKFSSPSAVSSPLTLTVIVLVVSKGLNVSVPPVDV